jgi:hypothetical protein
VFEVVYAIGLFALVLTPAVVTGLKGQRLLFRAGFATVGFVWLIAAFRLARPGSWWARRFYDEEKLRRARTRYPDADPAAGDRLAPGEI